MAAEPTLDAAARPDRVPEFRSRAVLRAPQGGVSCRLGSRLSTGEGVGMKELTCQELFTEACGEECFTANLKESRMFNI